MTDDKKIFICLAHFTAKDGCLAELTDTLTACVAPTKAEPGCLQYDLIKDIKNTNQLILIEKYINKQAFEAHINQPYIQKFVKNDMDRLCKDVAWHEGHHP